MRAIRTTIIVAIFLSLTSFHRPADLGDLIASLKTGDTNRINTYLDQSVDISLPGHNGVYDKTEAKKMLQLFFAQHPIKTFQVIHQTNLTGKQMCVGNLLTSNATYRATFLIQQKSGEQVLREIRFE